MPSGKLQGVTLDNRSFDVVDARGVHDVDQQDKVKKVIQSEKEDTEIFPLMSNFSMAKQDFDPAIGDVLRKDPAMLSRCSIRPCASSAAFPRTTASRSISKRFLTMPRKATSFSSVNCTEVCTQKICASTSTPGVGAEDQELKFLAANSDAILSMNYDQHETESDPGPIAGQDWFLANLRRVLEIVPKGKVICAIGNYGYDWTMSIPTKKGAKPNLSQGCARQRAGRVDTGFGRRPDHSEDDNLNADFAYDDEDKKVRHQVVFDAVTAMNQFRGARDLGLQTFALGGFVDQRIARCGLSGASPATKTLPNR